MILVARNYYVAKFHLDGRTAYFLWASQSEIDADLDEVWVRDGFARCFKSRSDLQRWATGDLGLKLEAEEPVLHQLDDVVRWLQLKKSKRSRQLPAHNVLSAWNLFADLARALKVPFRGDESEFRPLYSKVFWGSNLPALTPPGKRFRPSWSAWEIQIMREILSEGLGFWRASVRYAK